MNIEEYTLDGNTVKRTDRGTFWRMIHDGTSIVGIFQSSGITETQLSLFIAATEDECHAEANKLGLVTIPEPPIIPEPDIPKD